MDIQRLAARMQFLQQQKLQQQLVQLQQMAAHNEDEELSTNDLGLAAESNSAGPSGSNGFSVNGVEDDSDAYNAMQFNGDYDEDDDDDFPDTMQFVQAEYNNGDEDDEDNVEEGTLNYYMDNNDYEEESDESNVPQLTQRSQSQSVARIGQCEIRSIPDPGNEMTDDNDNEISSKLPKEYKSTLHQLLEKSIDDTYPQGCKILPQSLRRTETKKRTHAVANNMQGKINILGAGTSIQIRETNGGSPNQSSGSGQPVKKMPKLKPCPALLNATADQLLTINSNNKPSLKMSKPPNILRSQSSSQDLNNRAKKNMASIVPLSSFKNQSSSSSTSEDNNSFATAKGSTPNKVTLSQLGLKTKNLLIPRTQQQTTNTNSILWLQNRQQQLLQQQQQLQLSLLLGSDDEGSNSSSQKGSSRANVPRCSVCRKTFATHQVLLRHMDQHQHEYTCEACGKVCEGIFAFQKHMRIHQRSNVHRCRICYKTFTNLDNLKFHALTHTGEFKCRACRRGFPNMDELEAHEATHKRYECRWCDKYFMNSGNLKAHERIHTNERPYRCASCPKAFKQLGGLQYHLKTNPGHEAVKYPVYDNDNWAEEGQGSQEGNAGGVITEAPIILNIKTDMSDIMGSMTGDEDDDGEMTNGSFPEDFLNVSMKEEDNDGNDEALVFEDNGEMKLV